MFFEHSADCFQIRFHHSISSIDLGLSFVSKVAPKHLLGLCQGLWLGATAVGNLLLWIGPLMYNAIPIGYCWAIFMIVCLISMGVMLFMVKWLERVAK